MMDEWMDELEDGWMDLLVAWMNGWWREGSIGKWMVRWKE